jgi:hypothetical protein
MFHRMSTRKTTVAALAFTGCIGINLLSAQTCTTQAAMQPALRSALETTAMTIGSAVKAGDPATVKAASISEISNNFAGTDSLIRTTASKISGENLAVTHLFELDASARKAGDSSNADFSCILKGANSEADFSIQGLPPGDYAFAMVEATGGEHPWLISLLLQKDGATWKLAGFYPRARSLVGHDGLWYWTSARDNVEKKHPLLAWLYYTQAERLLEPAPFVESSNLDKLRSESRAIQPAEIANGLSASTPLVIKDKSGAEYKLTSIGTESASDGKSLHLVVHMVPAGAGDAAVKASSEAAARALVNTHPELKDAYSSVYVFADLAEGSPTVISLPTSQIQ